MNKLLRGLFFTAVVLVCFANQNKVFAVVAAPDFSITPSVSSISLPVGGGNKSFTFTIKNNASQDLAIDEVLISPCDEYVMLGGQYSPYVKDIGSTLLDMTYYPHVFSGAYRRSDMSSTFVLTAGQSVTGTAVLVPSVDNQETSATRTSCTLTIQVAYTGYSQTKSTTIQLINTAPVDPCAGKTCGCGTLPTCPVVDPCAGKTCGCGTLPTCPVADPCSGKTCGCGSLPACPAPSTSSLASTNPLVISEVFKQEGASTTDVSKLTVEQRKSVSNLIIDIPQIGKIEFIDAVDISGADIEEKFANLSSFVIIDDGRIAIDSEHLSALNKKAKLTMYNLKYPADSKIVVLRNGVDAGDYVENVNYVDGVLTFTVKSFSEYTVKLADDTNVGSTTTTSQTNNNVDSLASNGVVQKSDSEAPILIFVLAFAVILVLGSTSILLVLRKRNKTKSML